jgi:hypothetical protein
MRRTFGVVAFVFLAPSLEVAVAQEPAVDVRIAEAVSPLPESLRDGATVIEYDANWSPNVLRQGSNGITCSHDRPLPNEPPFGVRCVAASVMPQQLMLAKMIGSGMTHTQATAEVRAAKASGKLQTPTVGAMTYLRTGKSAKASTVVWKMLLPGAKAEDLGLPTKPSNGSPYMTSSGTPQAALVMPQTEASLAISR